MWKASLLVVALSGCTVVGAVAGGAAGHAAVGALEPTEDGGGATTGMIFGAVAGGILGFAIDSAVSDFVDFARGFAHCC